MCGKFTAMATWAQVVAFSQPLVLPAPAEDGEEDRLVTYRVMSSLPLIFWDIVEQRRRVVPMRWGWMFWAETLV